MVERGPSTNALAGSSGDSDESFALLYRRVAPALYAWAEIRMGRELRRFVAPEDFLQDVWVRAFSAIDRFEASQGSFRVWIFTIATRMLANRLRDAGRRPPGEALPPASAVPAEATRVSQALARNEAIAALVGAARRLSPDERRLFVLCGLEGVTASDAAPLLGAEAATVRKRWQRLRARLSELVEAAGVEDPTA